MNHRHERAISHKSKSHLAFPKSFTRKISSQMLLESTLFYGGSQNTIKCTYFNNQVKPHFSKLWWLKNYIFRGTFWIVIFPMKISLVFIWGIVFSALPLVSSESWKILHSNTFGTNTNSTTRGWVPKFATGLIYQIKHIVQKLYKW